MTALAHAGDGLIRDTLDTPVGSLLLVSRGPALVAADFEDRARRLGDGLRRRYPQLEVVTGFAPAAVRAALARYFDGDLAALDAVPVELRGTDFQRDAWQALRAIPAGTTVTYTELARLSGRPRAVRAAGHANGANPVSVVVPCHRVIGVDGSLTGYAGGLARKRWLLRHEGVTTAAAR